MTRALGKPVFLIGSSSAILPRKLCFPIPLRTGRPPTRLGAGQIATGKRSRQL